MSTTEKESVIDMSVLDYQLSKVIKHIVQKEPFYGMLAVTLNKEWTNKVPTAGVGLQGINYMLLINPDYFNSLPFEEKYGLIQHECLHLSHFHLTDFDHLKNKDKANKAMDIEINQLIDPKNLPAGGLMWNRMDPKYGLKAKEGTNTYYKKLPDDPKKDNGQSAGPTNHYWPTSGKDITPQQQQMAEQQLANTMQNIVNDIKDRGLIPAHVNELLNKKKIEPPKFNWKAYLRRYIGEGIHAYEKKSMRKRSKRFEFMSGSRRVELSNILIAIDISYSVSEE